MEENLQDILHPILRRIPLCQNLSIQGYKNLMRCVHEKNVPAGTFLFREGDPGDYLYIIAKGQVEILQGNPPQQAAVLKEEEFFGEMALLKGDIRNSSARALTDCSLYFIGQDCFQHLLETDTEFAMNISQAYVSRYKQNLRA